MSTQDKTHESGGVPKTEFGEKEQSRLAELLGDEYTQKCFNCSGTGIFRPPTGSRCGWCDGRGVEYLIPTGLALIEACRKRGVQISVDTFGDGYAVLSSANWCDGGFLHNGLRYCDYDDIESAIAIAALKGLEAVTNTEA